MGISLLFSWFTKYAEFGRYIDNNKVSVLLSIPSYSQESIFKSTDKFLHQPCRKVQSLESRPRSCLDYRSLTQSELNLIQLSE